MKDTDKLPGPTRVATFLLSLPTESAAEVLSFLPDGIIPAVSRAMVELDPRNASPMRIEELYASVAASPDGAVSVRPAGTSDLRALLRAALGNERGDEVVNEICSRREEETPFSEVEGFSPQAIAQALAAESPAVSALVLAHLEPAVSARVLSALDDGRALDVVRRMATLCPPHISTLRAIAADLADQLHTSGEDSELRSSAGRLQAIAEMLSHGGQELETEVLRGLESDNPAMAGEIREHMFTWDDLALVDHRDMQKILSMINTQTLSVALKACPPAVGNNILAGLSERVQGIIEEERELAGPVPMSDVLSSREEIMHVVRNLMESGEFRPRRAGEDLVE